MVRLLMVLWLAMAGTAHAQDRAWETHQIALGVLAAGLHIADWGQTRHIARSNEPGYMGERYIEVAPITREAIGEVPTKQKVDAYMLATGALFLGAAHLLPEYRTAILAIWAATRLQVVVNNYEIGLRVGGSF